MDSRRNRLKRRTVTTLQYADTERNADQFYFGRFQAPDPFISVGFEGEKIAFLSRLEIGRAKKESIFDTVLALEEWRDRAGRTLKNRTAGPSDIILLYCRERKIRRIRVGSDFPVGLAFRLRDDGLDLEVAPGMLFPEREIKSDSEANAISEGNRCSAAGIRAAERVLRKSTISGNYLVYRGRKLTSERLRLEIEKTCLGMGAVSRGAIAAGGAQACDPHCRGSGLLRPNQLIIVDVFPRVTKTGYFGDITRTFLKGHASEPQRKLVAAVRGAQKIALNRIKAGIRGHTVHREVMRHFEGLGYRMEDREAGPVGFIHGTGHGLGLEIHEPPRMSDGGPRLKKHQVVSVEPGLYYPEIGGCRIEDVVRIKSDGVEMLSKLQNGGVIA
jgi:Xaa-Pro aminopeptidase